MRAAELGGDVGCDGNALLVLCDVEVGLIKGERFNEVGVFGKDLADLLGDRAVDVEAWLDEDEVRAASLGCDRGQGRADAKGSRLIACRCHDTTGCRSTDGNRLTAELGIVALFHGGIESVHVYVDDLAHGCCIIRAFSSVPYL